jgi:hypothetical protein
MSAFHTIFPGIHVLSGASVAPVGAILFVCAICATGTQGPEISFTSTEGVMERQHRRFHPITGGHNVTIRVHDNHGCGLPGADRERENPKTKKKEAVKHAHRGSVDICAHPGHQVLSPIDGVAHAIKNPKPMLGGLLIVGRGAWKGYEVRLIHVAPVKQGDVTEGQAVGLALDMSRAYPGIMNHVHVQATKDGEWLNALHMFDWFSDIPASIPDEWKKR